MEEGVRALLADAGIHVTPTARSYRPHITLPGCEVKILKPQSIVEMLHAGSRDLGFAGADWVAELDGDPAHMSHQSQHLGALATNAGEICGLVELVDTGLDPVRVVVAAPAELLSDGGLPARHLVVASEYERLTTRWIAARGLDASFVRSYGATEVFPPEDADLIIDNTATGSTLRANGLEIVDELMTSSTRLYANPRALEEPVKRETIDRLVLLIRSVLEARLRVMVEVNVAPERLEAVIAVLPCMRQPTISPLAGGEGFAVKAAVPRAELPMVVPKIKAAGGTDIVVTRLAQIVA